MPSDVVVLWFGCDVFKRELATASERQVGAGVGAGSLPTVKRCSAVVTRRRLG